MKMKYIMNIIYVILLLQLFTQKLNSQIPVNVDVECTEYNCAMLCDALNECLGKKTISSWLDDNIHFGIYCDVDSLGFVKKIVRVHPLHMSRQIGKKKIKKIERYLITHKIPFDFCVCEPELSQEKTQNNYDRYLSDYFKYNKTMGYVIGNFPYDFMYGYEAEKNNTRYQYFMGRIYKYVNKNTKSTKKGNQFHQP